MKMTSLLIACGLAVAPAACKRDKKDDGAMSPKSVESAEEEAMESRGDLADERERDEFIAKAKARMSTLEARLSALRGDLAANARNLEDEVRADIDKLMVEIEAERARAKNAFDAAASGASDRWNELEKNTGEALEDLADKADSLAGKLKGAGVKLRAEAEAAGE